MNPSTRAHRLLRREPRLRQSTSKHIQRLPPRERCVFQDHAWDMRLISVERLIKLVQIKEKSDDPATLTITAAGQLPTGSVERRLFHNERKKECFHVYTHC